MMDKIVYVLNTVGSIFHSDRFATPLRMQRDLLYGPEIHPSEIEKTPYNSNSSGRPQKKMPPIDWKQIMGIKSPTFRT